MNQTRIHARFRSPGPAMIVILALCAGASLGAMPAGEPRPEPPATVTVVGTGTVEVVPDLATVRIGVETIGESVDEALAGNRSIIARMKDGFIGLGIAEEDLQTANYSFSFDRSSPETVTSRGTPQIRYYRVSNTLTVVIRELGLTADIIDAAVASGANQMWGVEFGIADPEGVERESLAAATLDARERAEHLASLSGMRLGEILRVSEVIGGSSSPVALRMEGYGGSASNVTPGRIGFSSRLEVVYSLIPVE